VHCHLRVAASLASTTTLGYLRRQSSHVQQNPRTCPIVCLHLKACSQWVDCDRFSVPLPRSLLTRRTRYNVQAMHKVLDSSRRFPHTCSSSTLIFYCVPVTAMTRPEEAAQIQFSMEALVSAAYEPRQQHSRLTECTQSRPIDAGIINIFFEAIAQSRPYIRPQRHKL
jgi:hypothetical protein